MIFRFLTKNGGFMSSRSSPRLFVLPSSCARSGQAPATATANSFRLFKNSNTLQQKYNYSTTSLVQMPLKKVLVFGLGSDDAAADTASGTLISTPRVKGSFVEAGDIVGVIETTSGKKKLEIPSPSTGRLVDIHFELNDTVKVGDALVTIDTDAMNELLSEEQVALKQHIESQGGTVSQDHIEQLCKDIDNVETLRGLATLISDQYPQLRVKALTILERVLELQQEDKLGNKEHTLNQATTHTDLGILLYRLGDLPASLTQLECALELRKVALGENHPELSATLIHMGAIYNQLNQHDECYEVFTKALEIQKQHLGQHHPLVAASLNNLGAICYHKGDYQGAIPHYQQALEIYLKQPAEQQGDGGDNKSSSSNATDTAGSYNNLAVAFKHTGQIKEAIEHCQKALSIRSEVLGPNHPDTAVSHVCLGQIFAETQQVEGAVEQFDRAIEIQTECYGANHPTTGTTFNHKGALYYEAGQFDQALDAYQKGLQSFQKSSLGEDAPQNADCWNNVGLAQQRLGKLDDALASHQSALNILQTKFGKDHPTLAMTFGNIASVYKSQKNYADALEYYKQSHVMLEQTLGANHDLVGSSYNNIGQVLALQGQLEDALLQYKAALQIFQETLSETHVYTGSLHYNIGLVHQQLGKPGNDARESYQKAYEIWEAALGKEHPQTNLAERAIELLDKTTSSGTNDDDNDDPTAASSK